MKKIISLFQRNYSTDRLVRDEVVPGAEWVLTGEGVATIKWDGTCCMISNGVLYKRYDAKAGRKVPFGFFPAQAPDPITGHFPGWLPVREGPDDLWHREAIAPYLDQDGRVLLPDGTYELCGPKVQGNPEGFLVHLLIRHGLHKLDQVPRTFAGLREYLREYPGEGIVWHHPDGRMVKIKGKDFGFKRPEAGNLRLRAIQEEEA